MTRGERMAPVSVLPKRHKMRKACKEDSSKRINEWRDSRDRFISRHRAKVSNRISKEIGTELI